MLKKLISFLFEIQKFKILVTYKQKQEILILFFFTILSMILEALSLGLIFPAISFLTNPNYLPPVWIKSLVGNYIVNPNSSIIVLILFSLAILYVIKSIFLTYFLWRQSRFIFSIQTILSSRIFSAYLNQPWPFYLTKNSAVLINNATTQVGAATGLAQGLLIILSEGFLILGTLAVFIWINLIETIMAFLIIGFVIWIFNSKTRELIKKIGTDHYFQESERIKNLQQGFATIKEIKLYGLEDIFLNKYNHHNYICAKAGTTQFTLQGVPRIWIELIFVLTILFFIFLALGNNNPNQNLISLMSFASLVAVRLMPSVSKFTTAIQSIRFLMPAMSNLSKELYKYECKNTIRSDKKLKVIDFSRSIQLKKVFFSYDSSKNYVLQDLNLIVPKGASIGIVGKTGNGKSTLIDLILGILEPSKGEILVDGINIKNNLNAWQNLLAYVPQNFSLVDDTLISNIAFGVLPNEVNLQRVMYAIRLSQLDSFVSNLPEGVDTIIGERGARLSGGQKQRIGIARALYRDSQVLILDEPTSSLDQETENVFAKILSGMHKAGKTILIVSHRNDLLKYCDSVFELNKRKIIPA